MPVPVGTQITIRIPDDFHHHCRDGSITETIIQHTSERFGRCLVMPNLKPPVVTTSHALQYKQHILDCYNKVSQTKSQSNSKTTNNDKSTETSSVTTTTTTTSTSKSFEPLMTLYLTESMTADEIYTAAKQNAIIGVKYYPAGATTNSDHGVSDIKKCYKVLEALDKLGLVLCIHSEVTYGDIFEREKTFINTILIPLINDFPTLKITMEHISTKDAIEYILYKAPATVKASVTCHHLLYNYNDLLVGGIKPHLYCLPILKELSHCIELCKIITSGTSNKFFLGTDSAPHTTITKESSCGCAGIYTAHCAIELYLEIFDTYDSLQHFENFASTYGAQHYNVPLSTRTITFIKQSWIVPTKYEFIDTCTGIKQSITPLRAGQEVQWQIVKET